MADIDKANAYAYKGCDFSVDLHNYLTEKGLKIRTVDFSDGWIINTFNVEVLLARSNGVRNDGKGIPAVMNYWLHQVGWLLPDAWLRLRRLQRTESEYDT